MLKFLTKTTPSKQTNKTDQEGQVALDRSPESCYNAFNKGIYWKLATPLGNMHFDRSNWFKPFCRSSTDKYHFIDLLF